VIGVAYPKWQERPMACAVPKPDEELTTEEILEFPGQGGQVVAPRRRGVPRGDPEDERRQVLDVGAPDPVRGLQATDGLR
jgi:hypothetical protein